MSNVKAEKDCKTETKSSSPKSNNVGAKSVGGTDTRSSRRTRMANGCSSRKCCACSQATTESEPKRPVLKSSLGDANNNKVVTPKKMSVVSRKNTASSDTKRKRSSATSVSREENAAQVQDEACNTNSKSEITTGSPATRLRSAARVLSLKKETDGQEIGQASEPSLITEHAGTPTNKIGTRATAPRRMLRKKAETKTPDGSINKVSVSTTKPESRAPPCSSSEKKSPESKFKKPPVPKQTSLRKEPTLTVQSSQPRRQSENSKGKSKVATSGLDRSSDRTYHLEHRIKWAGFDVDISYRVGQSCFLCENDLGVASWKNDQETEFSKLPVVSILSCGHALHHHCLDVAGFVDQEGDPPCVLCASFKS